MEVLRFALLGCATGSLFALVALGVVLVYRSSGVLNFAAGAVGAAGAFVFYGLRDDHQVNWLLALALGLATGIALGVFAQLVVMGMLRRASSLVKLIATLGIMSLIQGGISIIWGTTDRPQPMSILPATAADRIRVFGSDQLIMTKDRVVIILIALALAVALRVVYSKSLFGLATSAVAENRQVAAMGGWSTTPIELVNFGLSGLLSAGAAILLAPIVGLSPAVLTLTIVPALAAALVGNFASFGLTVAGALSIGVLQSEVQRYVTVEKLSGLADSVPLLIIIVVSVIRGRNRLGRSELSLRLPAPGTGRVPWPWLLAGLTVSVLLVLTVNPAWADALTVTFGTGTLILSVVAVTGLGGQLSLSQYALAGFGVWVTARLSVALQLPLELAIPASIVATVLLGLLVALPALRARGVDLAVATLGLALMIQAMIFNNSALTGGYFGTNVQGATLFGWNIDAVVHPSRYAFLSLVFFVVAGFVVANVRRGRAGLRLLAVRSNERAAASLGVGVYLTKLYAFGLGAAVAALAGFIIGFHTNNVLFQQFDAFGSITALQYAVVGGIAWVGGAAIGALLAGGGVSAHLFESLFSISRWILVIGGAAVIAVLISAPEGQASVIARQLRGIARKLREPRKPKPFAGRPTPYRDRQPVVVQAEGISVRFGGVLALSDVSFQMRPGEILGVIGPNGAGKTTLLDVLTGFSRSNSGSVTVDGAPIDGWSPERRARAGLIRSFQAVELFDELTVRDNLLIAADRHRRRDYLTSMVRPGRLAPSRAMLDAITDLELADVLDELPSELSHGVARKVGIARAIVAEPSALFLDEPAAGLDAAERAELGVVIRRIAENVGIGIVLIEHDVPLVTSICDRILVLDFGHVIAVGTPAEIERDPAVIRAYLGQDSATEDDRALDLTHG